MDTRLSSVVLRVAAAAERAGRSADSVRVVAVTKDASDAALLAIYDAGARDFGENRSEHLAARAGLLPDDIRWHFIGRLQGNKVKTVRPIVHLLHSLDRSALAAYWSEDAKTVPPALVQVNVSGEPQKAGVAPVDTARLVGEATHAGIEVRGLMTVPPVVSDAEGSRRHFVALRDLRDRLQGEFPTLRELSMGMSDDYEVAVEEGATILRVGRAIFPPSPEKG